MICIAGKNNIAVDVLDYALRILDIDKSEIIALPNHDDIGGDTWQCSLRRFCCNEKIEISSIEELYGIRNLVFLSLEYNRIIKPVLFSSTQLFNIHFSKLPKYRGVYTSAWPILNGEKETGVTLHKIDAGIDTGDIIDQISFEIAENDTAYDLYLKYIKYGTMLAKENLKNLLNGAFTSKAQGCDGASYYGKNSINFSSLEIDFFQTAFNIRNQIKAFYFPAFQTSRYCQKSISKCEILGTKSVSRPGAILETGETYFIVSSLDYDVKLVFSE